MMIVAAVVLGGLALRRRLPLWEYVALVGLAVATVIAARNGSGCCCSLLRRRPRVRTGARRRCRVVPRPTVDRGARRGARGRVACAGVLVHRAQAIAEDDDQLAAEVDACWHPDSSCWRPNRRSRASPSTGCTVWLEQPAGRLLARTTSAAYLDFMAGRPGMAAAVEASDAVLVRAGERGRRRAWRELAGFEVHDLDGRPGCSTSGD